MINAYMPVRLYAGRNCIEEHGAELKKLGDRCFIVTGASSAKKSGALDAVVKVLTSLNITYRIDNSIKENPLLKTASFTGTAAYEFGADFIIGIGGGSPMDAAKAVSVFAANPMLDEAAFYDKQWAKDPLPIVQVGTTAGTGSEVTDVAVMTDSKGRKHSIHDERLYPVISFGDPAFTLSLPRAMTLSTGLDVLAHAVESYFSKKADTLSQVYAVAAIKKLYGPLLRATLRKEIPYEDRETLYESSLLAGLAISRTGTVFPHNMGYYLTEQYHVPHGTACGVFLNALLDHVGEEAPELGQKFYKELGVREGDMRELIRTVLIKPEISMTEEEIDRILPRYENNNSINNTVGHMTPEKVKKVFMTVFGPGQAG